jgi:glyoxylase-like metal-dependent hydrolase (beta-lactamase superfamily II)
VSAPPEDAVAAGGADVRTPIDLFHCGDERRVGCFVVETDDGLALFDCGPATCLPSLRTALGERGLELGEIRHLLLSHIHLDHAGAAGAIVAEHPQVTVHVSEIGAPHLVDPTRLEASARRLWGDAFDDLWGPLTPVPEERVRVVGESTLGLETFPTPGHAAHHVSYLHEDGTLYCGDAAGVRITPGRFVFPPTPPPEVDLEAWETTIDALEQRRARRLALIHFGMFDDPERHLASFRDTLRLWAERVALGMGVEAFVAAAAADVARSDPDEVAAYDRSAPYEHCFAGLERYWRKRRAATVA